VRIPSGEGDEAVKSAGIVGNWYWLVESCCGAALRGEGLLGESQDVVGVGVGHIERPICGDGEIPAVDDQFERQHTGKRPKPSIQRKSRYDR
jgi:hypothetical protein